MIKEITFTVPMETARMACRLVAAVSPDLPDEEMLTAAGNVLNAVYGNEAGMQAAAEFAANGYEMPMSVLRDSSIRWVNGMRYRKRKLEWDEGGKPGYVAVCCIVQETQYQTAFEVDEGNSLAVVQFDFD